MTLPDSIDSEEQLLDVLTSPSPGLVTFAGGLSGTIAVLGVGGKMGATVALRLVRAIQQANGRAKVIGVSRFTSEDTRQQLEDRGISTFQADLLNPEDVADLPDAAHVIYLAGRKFGTTGNEGETWAMNALPPVYICKRYAGVRMVAYSTGAVYDMVPATSSGAREDHPMEPRGEYANAAVARERLFQWASVKYETPVCLIRLYYANDLTYGVIRDVAESILTKKPIDLTMGYVNLIWQGDAADQSIRALDLATVPPTPLNVTGPDVVPVRYLAERLGEVMGIGPIFQGESAPDALLGNTNKASGLFGYPEVPLDRVIQWTGRWVLAGGRGLGKLTHWEVRDGRY